MKPKKVGFGGKKQAIPKKGNGLWWQTCTSGCHSQSPDWSERLHKPSTLKVTTATSRCPLDYKT